jgi:hypothetical protein
LGIHFFLCANGGERTISHDVVQDVFASIARDAGFHILGKQIHVLPPPFFKSFYRWVDIVLSMDGICTLVDVIIVDPTGTNLVSWVAHSHGVVTTVAARVKENLCCDHYPTNMFFPLAI